DAETSLQPLTTRSEVAVVSATSEWPRTALVVTEIPDDANTPLLIGLRQDDPRSSYQMFSWVRLLPGVTMPETEVAEIGSTPVDVEDDVFLVSAAEALEQYADLLTEGSDSDYEDVFAEEPFREAV